MEKPFRDKFSRLFTQKNIAAACVVLLLLSLVPLFVLAFYNHPCSDDFNYGLYAHQAVQAGGTPFSIVSAAVRKTMETFQNWQGTFSAVFLMALHPAVFGEQFYALTPFIMLGAVLFGNFFFLKELCVRRLHMAMPDYIILACAVSFFSIQLAPSAFEGFFWFNGAVFYTFFYGLTLCLFTLILKFLAASARGRRTGSLVAMLALSVLIGGGNYPTALLSCVLLLGITVYLFLRRAPLFQKICLALCFVLETGAFFLSITAPGNAVRQAFFTSHPSAVQSVLEALKTSAEYVLNWTGLPMLLALLFLAPMLYRAASKLSFSFRWPVLAPLFSICFLGVLMTPPIYAMGFTGASRLTNLFYFFYCLLAVGNVFYFCGWISHRFGANSSQDKKWTSVYQAIRPAYVLSVTLLFGISFLCLPSFRSVTTVSAVLSLKRGEAQTYHGEMQARLARYLDPEIKDVVVSPLTVRPELLLPKAVPDLTDDPENKANKRVAAFYNKDSVRNLEPR